MKACLDFVRWERCRSLSRSRSQFYIASPRFTRNSIFDWPRTWSNSQAEISVQPGFGSIGISLRSSEARVFSITENFAGRAFGIASMFHFVFLQDAIPLC